MTLWCRHFQKVLEMAGKHIGQTINVFLCGDVMLARGIDMIQQQSCNPKLYEGNGLDAYDYVKLATDTNGPLPPKKEIGPEYVWGHALKVFEMKKPDLRIINLETSITTHDEPWPRKGINYRMHPKNVSILKAASIDCCSLANNHTADWGFEGLRETLTTLKSTDIAFAGAGFNQAEAEAPAIFSVARKGRVLVFAAGHFSSGVPDDWKATSNKEGVNILDIHVPSKSAAQLQACVKKYKRVADIAVLSIHWGGNWGFKPEVGQREFAQKVIDSAGIDVIHGHSSHHVKGIEIYKDKLIIYGCGDFINDYEGISGKEEFRGDLALMYFVEVDPETGKTKGVTMVPTQTRHLTVNKANERDTDWMYRTMKRECAVFNTQVQRCDDQLQLVI